MMRSQAGKTSAVTTIILDKKKCFKYIVVSIGGLCVGLAFLLALWHITGTRNNSSLGPAVEKDYKNLLVNAITRGDWQGLTDSCGFHSRDFEEFKDQLLDALGTGAPMEASVVSYGGSVRHFFSIHYNGLNYDIFDPVRKGI